MSTKTLEEAIKNQRDIHNRVDDGEYLPNWRTHSLKENFEFKSAPHHGMGKYPVCKCCGAVCNCQMEWDDSGTVLICPNCFLDGT